MITPRSGRSGFLFWDESYIPIYFVSSSYEQKVPVYFRSDTENQPVRPDGLFEESFILRGAQHLPLFYSDALIGSSIEFDIGWFDITTNQIKFITVSAMMMKFAGQFNYTIGSNPSFFWTAEFLGCSNTKEIDTSSLSENFGETRFCSPSICDAHITTSDSQLNSGVVKHVYTARFEQNLFRPLYYTSNSNNHYSPTYATYDTTLQFALHGDFDYWLSAVENYSDAKDYRLYYSGSEYWSFPDMKAVSYSNFNINIITGELISALISLGVSK